MLLSGSNPLDPDEMSAAERLAEVAEILAAGQVRLRARQSSRLSADSGEISLHFTPARAVVQPAESVWERAHDRYRAGPASGPEEHADAGAEGAVAHALRQRAAAVQSQIH